ncbi:MAG: hypothetical protein KBS46_05585 [Clostridiales bacterium]|nr:hypothetical protein [Candidatus Apopatocola equi]
MVIRWILYVLLALLILLLISRYGAEVSYIEKKLRIRIRVGPVLFELPKGDGKKKKKEKHPDKPPEEKPEKEKKKQFDFPKPTWEDIPVLADMALTALGRVFRAIEPDELMLHLAVGFPDPYDTAVRLNYVNTAAEILLNGGLLRPKKQDVAIWPDFAGETCSVEARLALSLRLYKIVAAGLALLWSFLRWKRQKKKSADNAERT